MKQVIRSALIAITVTMCLAVLHGRYQVPLLTCFLCLISVYLITVFNTVWALSEKQGE